MEVRCERLGNDRQWKSALGLSCVAEIDNLTQWITQYGVYSGDERRNARLQGLSSVTLPNSVGVGIRRCTREALCAVSLRCRSASRVTWGCRTRRSCVMGTVSHADSSQRSSIPLQNAFVYWRWSGIGISMPATTADCQNDSSGITLDYEYKPRYATRKLRAHSMLDR